jgi:hypothetical protein
MCLTGPTILLVLFSMTRRARGQVRAGVVVWGMLSAHVGVWVIAAHAALDVRTGRSISIFVGFCDGFIAAMCGIGARIAASWLWLSLRVSLSPWCEIRLPNAPVVGVRVLESVGGGTPSGNPFLCPC